MPDHKVDILYILGAGRSGSTALATLLGASDDICFLGEMHQFYKYLGDEQNQQTPPFLRDSHFWYNVLTELPANHHHNALKLDRFNNEMEAHKKIPWIFLSLVHCKKENSYHQTQDQFFSIVSQRSSSSYLLDSSKYIARFLRLRRLAGFRVKGLYLVRDIRGVIWSFQKNVQTSNPPLRTILYYCLINLWGEIVYRTSPTGSIKKVRYEDLMADPVSTILEIGTFTNADIAATIEKLERGETFNMPTVIGGNRITTEQHIRFRKDIEWMHKMPRWQQVLYFFISWPFQLINRYSI